MLLFFSFIFLVSSCGYRMIGSKFLPFDSITIKPVLNQTYEPRLEEKMHNALSEEFIRQGIRVKADGSTVYLETVVTNFGLSAVGMDDEKVVEQSISMNVNVKIVEAGKATEFRSMRSPINITFQSTGTVSETVANKERAIDKASREIAKEIVSRIIIRYAR